MLKKGFKIVIFLAMAAVLFIFCCSILRHKSMNGIDPMYAFYNNEENTVDALFLGSSHMFDGVNTGVLWDEFGISGYDLGGADQPFWNTYYYLKEALKTQRPKVIVVELYSAAVQKGHYQHLWAIENLYGMRFNRNYIEAVKESVPKEEQMDHLIPFVNYHSRYSMLSKDDFDYEQRMMYHKGFKSRYGTSELETPDISMVTDLQAPNEKMADYMIKIIDLAKEENIPILLVCAPYAINEEQQKIFNCFYQYADEHGVPYIDFNKNYAEVGIDFQKDFYDWSHLNEQGNEKYTRYLGTYLANQYQLPDHRGDRKYDSWESDARYLEAERKAFELPLITDFNLYLTKLHDEDYVVMMTARNLSDVSLIPEDTMQAMESLGLSKEMLISEGNAIIRNGQAEQVSIEQNCELFTNDIKHDMGIFRTYIEPNEEVYDDTPYDATKILVDEKDYFMEDYDINLVVYDCKLGYVVDAAGIQIGETVNINRIDIE